VIAEQGLFPHDSTVLKMQCSGKLSKNDAKKQEKLCVGKLAKKGLTNIRGFDIIINVVARTAKTAERNDNSEP